MPHVLESNKRFLIQVSVYISWRPLYPVLWDKVVTVYYRGKCFKNLAAQECLKNDTIKKDTV